MPEAVSRRLHQELGLECRLNFVYKFEYVAPYRNLGTEHELCWVYVGRASQDPVINTTEIHDWRWLAPRDVTRALADPKEPFTPWFKLEWARLKREFGDDLAGIRHLIRTTE